MGNKNSSCYHCEVHNFPNQTPCAETFQRCKRHTCVAKYCTNSTKYYDSSKCVGHTCRTHSCKNDTTPTSSFCILHACKNQYCCRSKLEDDTLCTSCNKKPQCSYKGCINRYDGTRDYSNKGWVCTDHICKAGNCAKVASTESSLCKSHKCSEQSCAKIATALNGKCRDCKKKPIPGDSFFIEEKDTNQQSNEKSQDLINYMTTFIESYPPSISSKV